MKKDILVSWGINVVLFFCLLITSYVVAFPVGEFITPHLPGTDIEEGYISGTGIGNFLSGIPFSYLFLLTFLFGLMGKGRVWTWFVICALPMVYCLFYLKADLGAWLWSAVFFALGIILALIFRPLIEKRSAI